MPGTMPSRGNIAAQWIIAPSLSPAALTAAAGPQEQTFTVKGLQTTDMVAVTTNGAQTAKVSLGGSRVSAADTLAITFVNTDTGTPTPYVGVYLVEITRPESYATLSTTAG